MDPYSLLVAASGVAPDLQAYETRQTILGLANRVNLGSGGRI